ncbi:MAG: hypothetical protein QMD12_00870 [Candidatus Aenigmarchaeota archaeon]|nr:hypothetical protein [Candidatus Aenigmarchaeota archaeon]
MEILEAFGRAVNTSFRNIEDSLKSLNLCPAKLEKLIKSKKFLIAGKKFDIVIDFKPKLNQVILYLTPKRWSKKFVKKLNPNLVDFKSMVTLLGNVPLFGKSFELRLGAFGISSSDLVRAIIKFKE